MLTLALTLLTTQGVIQPSNFSLDARDDTAYTTFGARLTKPNVNAIGEGMLLAQAEGEGPPPIPGGVAPPRSLQDLRAEYQRLDESRPGIVGPIVMLAIGVPLIVVGISVFVLVGLNSLFYSFSSYIWLIGLPVGVILFVAGLVLAIVGGVKLGRGISGRREVSAQMEEIKRQIDLLETAPPPPPPPSSVERNGPAPLPGLVMAEF